jgi:hypothetical protein
VEADRENLLNKISDNTINYRIRDWVDNFKGNLEAVQGGYGVMSMMNVLDRVPAIIVGSGPTLDWNIDELREAQDRACIIASDSSLKALLAHGVTPHLVLCTDSKKSVSGFFSDLDTTNLNFIMDTFVHPSVASAIEGRLYWYNTMPVEKCAFTRALNQWTGATGNLGTGGCVTTTAWWFANSVLGCDPTILVGMPEAFYDPRKMYAQCVNETVKTEPYNAQAIKVKDIFGNDCYTFMPLQSFAFWFEDAFLNIQRIHINCSEGGILQRNVLNMPLIACIERYLQPVYDIESMLFCKEIQVDEMLAQCGNEELRVHRPMMVTLLDGPSLPNLSLRMGKEEQEVHADIDELRNAGFIIEEHRNQGTDPGGQVIENTVFTLKSYGVEAVEEVALPQGPADDGSEVPEPTIGDRIVAMLSSRGGAMDSHEISTALDSEHGIVTEWIAQLVQTGSLIAEPKGDRMLFRSVA